MRRLFVVLMPVVLLVGVPVAVLTNGESRGMPKHGSAGDGDFVAYRDWQIENPFVAGALKGLTLMLIPRPALGEGWRLGDREDPYAVSGLVHRHMTNMSVVPYRIGMAAGFAFWLSMYLAMVYRYLNKLEPAAEQSMRYAHR